MSALSPDSILALRGLSMSKAVECWDELEKLGRRAKNLEGVTRELCCADLFYLLVRACRRLDMLHPWIYARCREVEAAPDEYVDLWFREGYKSTIKTFGLTIQEILKNPEVTVGFFSHTRPIAKAFLRQIMRELETNIVLHRAFPDVLWGMDTKQAPKWSEDDGIIVKRKSNPNEATIEAWGLVDGQPTSKHFEILNYDDIVTDKSVTTPEMIEKTTDAVALSGNLGKRGGRRRYTGTFYHFGDTYKQLILRGTAKPRIHPATDDGTEEGKSVLLTDEQLRKKRKDMGPYIFGCQMLLNPRADVSQGFKREWLRFYKHLSVAQMKRMNLYILVDSANAKRKESDYTSMWVIGLNVDQNYYVLDMVRDRLNLTERASRLMALHRKYKSMGCRILQVRYERYGMMADIDHIKTVQEQENYRFDITEVGGATPKDDRIKRMIPIYEQARMYAPLTFHVTDYQGTPRNLVHDFVEEEYMAFPVSIHKDMLDSLSRIAEPDLKLVWPKEERIEELPPPRQDANAAVAWMA